MPPSKMAGAEPTINPKYLDRAAATKYPDNSTAHGFLTSNMVDALHARILDRTSQNVASREKKSSPYTDYGTKGETVRSKFS